MPQYRLGGVTLGTLAMGPGTRYHVTELIGVDDLPEVRASDLAKEQAHGDYSGPDFVGPRVVQIGLGLRGDDPDHLRDLTIALRAATQPQRQPIELRFTDWGYLLYAKVRRRAVPYDAQGVWRNGTAALELYCADPHLYSLDEHALSTEAYSPSAGRTYPRTYPLSYGLPGASGRLSILNGGDAPSYPVLRLDGPVANPRIEQTNTGALLQIAATLNVGESLLIDARTRAVLFMGTAPRRSWVQAGSTWPQFMPGLNEIVYRGDAVDGSPGQPSLLTVTWRDASL